MAEDTVCLDRSSKLNRLEARVSADQKQLFQRAASLLGRPLTDFIISSLREAALRVIKEHEIIQLATQDRKIFTQSLARSSPPNIALVKASQHYQKIITTK